MKRLAWATDIHLNFLTDAQLTAFANEVARLTPDSVLVTGDIGEADSVVDLLVRLQQGSGCPVCFVLGNHDFYGASIADVREQVARATREYESLTWLTATGVVEVSAATCLVGHDSWADGRFGNFAESPVLLSDHFLVLDLAGRTGTDLLMKLQELGDQAAAHFRAVLPQALERYQHVVLLTHAPPFREACRYEGRISNDDWLPHLSCKAVGDVLLETMSRHPDRRMTVLCGHTHGEASVQILPNLRVETGGAVYGRPVVQRVFELE